MCDETKENKTPASAWPPGKLTVMHLSWGAHPAPCDGGELAVVIELLREAFSHRGPDVVFGGPPPDAPGEPPAAAPEPPAEAPEGAGEPVAAAPAP